MANYNSIFKAPDFAIIAPIRNGADKILLFLEQLNSVLEQIPATFTVLIIDDASVDATTSHLENFRFSAANARLQSIQLPFYSGLHQAVASGLSVARQLNCQQFIVMQADGEDDPAAIPELINIRDKDAVIVDRGPRTEHLLFWIVYRMYQFFFRLFTSRELIAGIYSMINRRTLIQLTQEPFMHYTARLYKLKLRGDRLRIKRKDKDPSFKSEWRQLFQDSVRSYMEFGEELLSAFIKLSLTFGFLFFAGVLTVLYFYFISEAAVPVWLLVATAGLLSALICSMGVFGIGVSVLHKVRSYAGISPYIPQEPSEAQSDNNPLPRKAPIRLK